MTLTFTSYRFKRWAVLIHERDNGFLYTRKFETKLQFQEEQFIIFEHPVANENWVYKTTLKAGGGGERVGSKKVSLHSIIGWNELLRAQNSIPWHAMNPSTHPLAHALR